jgi:glycosyltransferase involved in cell wall biosynthesis
LYKADQLDAAIVRRDFVYDIERWIAACDVVCVPHVQPHFSRTIMEAGAMKKPVAAFKVGGVEEVVQHEVTGLMCRCGDVKGLAEAVARLLQDRALAKRLGEGGYAQAIREFDARGHACKVAAIYTGLTNDER